MKDSPFRDIIRENFKPSGLEILGILLLDILILAGFNGDVIFAEITSGVPVESAALTRSVSDQLSGISQNAVINSVTIAIFWTFIGLAVYTLFWVALNFFISVKNEVVIETGYVNKAKFGERMKLPLIQVGVGALAALMTVAAMKFFFPLWLSLMRHFVVHIQTIDLQTILMALAALAGGWLTIYLLISLFKLTFAIGRE